MTSASRMYGEFARYYPLIDPVADHADEAFVYINALLHGVPRNKNLTLLEFGSGAGNNASYAKSYFNCTLVDLAPAMLELSRAQNPECEHVQGDMRSVRLGREFDVCFVHDAISYLTSEAELRRVIDNVALHTKYAALFAPDFTRENFVPSVELIEGRAGDRALVGTEWCSDPNPHDSLITVDYTFTVHDGAEVFSFHDRFSEGLFPQATWLRLFDAAGFDVSLIDRPIGDGAFDKVYLCVKRPPGPLVTIGR